MNSVKNSDQVSQVTLQGKGGGGDLPHAWVGCAPSYLVGLESKAYLFRSPRELCMRQLHLIVNSVEINSYIVFFSSKNQKLDCIIEGGGGGGGGGGG